MKAAWAAINKGKIGILICDVNELILTSGSNSTPIRM